MGNTGTAGNTGKTVRSDCFVTLELADSEGIDIRLDSKVNALYGNSIRALCANVLTSFGIEHAHIHLEDSGALDFVLAARIEAAVKQCIETDKNYCLEMLPENRYHTAKNCYRRSRLYLPGNTPKFMINAGLHRPDGIILDLEDSVAPLKKAEARILVRNALCQVDFYGTERMVRINQIPQGFEDLEYVLPYNVHLLLVPKCEIADQIRQLEDRIAEIARKKQIITRPYLMPIIESALGVINAYDIATASEQIVALAIGLEDYTADIGTQRTKKGRETLFARSQIVNAARAAGIQPIDSVFPDVSDLEALREVALESKALGFDGMGCIHPRQIQVIHEAFAPTTKEIEKAQHIVNAFHDATEQGLGVVTLETKMIDAPVVKRAHRAIDLAIKAGTLSPDWGNGIA